MPFAAAIPAIMGGASILGKLFGGGAKAAAEARAKEAEFNQRGDQIALSRYGAEQNANTQNANTDLNQRSFALQAPGQRAGNSVRGDILATLQKPGGQYGKFNFTGMAPSLSDNTRQTGQLMARDALLQQLKGDTFDPIPKLKVPTATPIPKAGKMEKFGGLAGLIGGIAGGLQEMGIGQQEDGASSVLGGASRPGGRLPSRPVSWG